MSVHFEVSVISTEITEDIPRVSCDGMDEAFVLHVRPYRETSCLIDLFSRDRGRLRLLAKGVRRGRRSPADLAPFSRIRYQVGGRGDLRLLTHSEPIVGFPRLTAEALYCGFYVAELLIRLLPLEDAHPELYDASATLLGDLASGARREPLLRLFERALLDELGYGLSLMEDVEGRSIRPDGFYRYHPELGAECISADQGGIPGSALLALASGCFPDEADLVWAKRLMRMVLDPHLEGRPLKSRELFQTFSRSRSE
jgi:DNA repair protein RecO (recombination protein O)